MAISYKGRACVIGFGIPVFLLSGLDATYCASYSSQNGVRNIVYTDCAYGCCGTSRNLYCCSFSVGTTVGYAVGGVLLLLIIILYCYIRRQRAKSRPAVRTAGTNGIPFIYYTSRNGFTTSAMSQLYLASGNLSQTSPEPPPPYLDSSTVESRSPQYTGQPPDSAGQPPPFEGQPPAFADPPTAFGDPPLAFGDPPTAFADPPPSYSEVVKTQSGNPPAYDNSGFSSDTQQTDSAK